MVSIFTYRDERKLFAVIATVVVAALVALVQIDAARNGRPSPLTVVVSTVALGLQTGATATADATRHALATVVSVPRLETENRDLRVAKRDLGRENAALTEVLARQPDELAEARALERFPGGVRADVVGYDPENAAQVVTLDRGSRAGIKRDDGVVADEGVVGRVIAVEPFGCTVLLISDATSKLPAIVQRGRWWGIAVGIPQNGTIALEYVSQDARLRVGDRIVTGSGRTFGQGLTLGRIAKLYHSEGALYQTAIVAPAVRFGRLSSVVVTPAHSHVSAAP